MKEGKVHIKFPHPQTKITYKTDLIYHRIEDNELKEIMKIHSTIHYTIFTILIGFILGSINDLIKIYTGFKEKNIVENGDVLFLIIVSALISFAIYSGILAFSKKTDLKKLARDIKNRPAMPVEFCKNKDKISKTD